MEIIHRNNGRDGVFMAVENGMELGEMTYGWDGNKRIIIDHTEVTPQYSGRGIGKKLVEAAVEYARENQICILPLCSFAKAVIEKNPGLQDIL